MAAPVTPAVLGQVFTELHTVGVSCAPHVLTRLFSRLGGDPASIVETAALLDPGARAGLIPLPRPLPLAPSIARLFEGLRLGARDRDLLSGVVLCGSDELAPLLDFDGRSVEEISRSGASPHLVIRVGHVRFVDPRLAVWIEHSVPPADAARVHERLGRVFRERGDRVAADWHLARASTCGLADAAPELIRIARSMSEEGHPDRALQLAAEAAAHAEGIVREEAVLVAGAAAIGAGYAIEAARWLGELFPDAKEKYRLQGLSGLLIARAHLQGAVPDVDPEAFRPRTDDADDWYSWTRAAAFASVLCAERRDRAGMRAWLAAVREGCARTGAEQRLRDPVVALSWLIAGEHDVDAVPGTGPLSGGLLQALHSGLAGNLDRGLRILGAGDSGLTTEIDAFVEGFEHSPVVRAYRAVLEVLLLTWRGDIAIARDVLHDAALALPVAMPFNGLGVALARRLDLAVIGTIGPVAESLSAALPSGVRMDRFVDRAIEAFLGGSFDDASALLHLWVDRGSPAAIFGLPGLDEVVTAPQDEGPIIEPPECAAARRLRGRISSASESLWHAELDEIAEAARALSSPFERGRVEAMIGVRASIGQSPRVAREHLRSAHSLLIIAGATAWARAVAERLDMLEAETSDRQALGEDLSACRSAWESLLTRRELDVAMRVVGGASNRRIGDDLHLSVRTVEVHLGRVFAKLDVRTRVELTVLAHRTGRYL